MYGRSVTIDENVKVERGSTFTFTRGFSYSVSIFFTHVKPVKVYVRTHVKITRQWKSTLIVTLWSPCTLKHVMWQRVFLGASEFKLRNLIWWTGHFAIYVRWLFGWCYISSLHSADELQQEITLYHILPAVTQILTPYHSAIPIQEHVDHQDLSFQNFIWNCKYNTDFRVTSS